MLKICVIFCIFLFISVEATYYDTRCKCVCNLPTANSNFTLIGKQSFIRNVESEKCQCRFVLPEVEPKYCPRCECKYQSRKTKIIEVVVWLVIFVIISLVLYMIVLQFIELFWRGKSDSNYLVTLTKSSSEGRGEVKIIKQMFGRKKQSHDKQPFATRDQLNESIAELPEIGAGSQGDTVASTSGESSTAPVDGGPMSPSSRTRTRSETVSDVVNRARIEQSRWRGNVQMQRDRVFHDHSMLN